MHRKNAQLLSTIFNLKVQNKSCNFPVEISVKTLYFIITAWMSLIKRVVKQRSNSESVLYNYQSHTSLSAGNYRPGP